MQLNIDGWKQHLCFSAAHILPQHQTCGILHGHTYVISCTIKGTPDPRLHMLIDFTILKKILKTLIEPLDHSILIPEQHPLLTIKNSEITIRSGTKIYTLPKDDCTILPIPATTVEHLSEYLLTQLIQKLPHTSNLKHISLQIDEGLGQSALAEKAL